MKKTRKGKATPFLYVYRFVKQLFSSFIKHQYRDYKADNEKIAKILHNMQDSIEIIARWVKSSE